MHGAVSITLFYVYFYMFFMSSSIRLGVLLLQRRHGLLALVATLRHGLLGLICSGSSRCSAWPGHGPADVLARGVAAACDLEHGRDIPPLSCLVM